MATDNKKAYKKPVQISVGNLLAGKGSCLTGISVHNRESSNSLLIECSAGNSYGLGICVSVGISASDCSSMGDAAGLIEL